MKNHTMKTITTVLLLLLASCDGGNSGTVAIVDLKSIADATGRSQSMQAELAQVYRTIQSRTQERQKQLDAQFNADREALGDNSTEEQRSQLEERLAVDYRQLQAQVQGEQIDAQQRISAVFRQDVSPFVRSVSKQRGFSIVIVRNDSILALSPTVDITGEVIKGMMVGQPPLPGSIPDPSPTTPSPAP